MPVVPVVPVVPATRLRRAEDGAGDARAVPEIVLCARRTGGASG
jgi:hypothetical protein